MQSICDYSKQIVLTIQQIDPISYYATKDAIYVCYNDTILKKLSFSSILTQVGASVFFEGYILLCLQTDNARHIYCLNDVQLQQLQAIKLKVSTDSTSCLATVGNFLLVLDQQNCIQIYDKRLRNIKTLRNCNYLQSFYSSCFFLQSSKIWFVDKYLNFVECSQINFTGLQNQTLLLRFCQDSAVYINEYLYFIKEQQFVPIYETKSSIFRVINYQNNQFSSLDQYISQVQQNYCKDGNLINFTKYFGNQNLFQIIQSDLSTRLNFFHYLENSQNKFAKLLLRYLQKDKFAQFFTSMYARDLNGKMIQLNANVYLLQVIGQINSLQFWTYIGQSELHEIFMQMEDIQNDYLQKIFKFFHNSDQIELFFSEIEQVDKIIRYRIVGLFSIIALTKPLYFSVKLEIWFEHIDEQDFLLFILIFKKFLLERDPRLSLELLSELGSSFRSRSIYDAICSTESYWLLNSTNHKAAQYYNLRYCHLSNQPITE